MSQTTHFSLQCRLPVPAYTTVATDTTTVRKLCGSPEIQTRSKESENEREREISRQERIPELIVSGNNRNNSSNTRLRRLSGEAGMVLLPMAIHYLKPSPTQHAVGKKLVFML